MSIERYGKTKRQFYFDPEDLARLDANVQARHLMNRAQLLRIYIRADAAGELLLVDDALRGLARILGTAFGGTVGEMAAQAELYMLSKRLRA